MRCVCLALAFVVAASCGGSPTKPNPLSDQPGWGGTVTFSQTTNAPSLAATVAWTGNVFWEDSLLADLNGATIFRVKSGSVSATYDGTAPCPASGLVTAAEVSIDPAKDSTLTVQANGSYSGSFHAVATITVRTADCPEVVVPPPAVDHVKVGLDLLISGNASGFSLKGKMAPVVLAPTTYEGSWDFAPIATVKVMRP